MIGLPFDDPDDVVRAAVEQASVPALLMSMVHMTGDVGLLDELPGPYALIAMDLQGAMSEDDKNRVRRLSLIHISEPTRLLSISYAVFCL